MCRKPAMLQRIPPTNCFKIFVIVGFYTLYKIALFAQFQAVYKCLHQIESCTFKAKFIYKKGLKVLA